MVFKLGRQIALLLVIIILLYACARIQLPEATGVQTGMASWYGNDFHGRTTASKEIYDMYDLTAAHRSLPFGTKVMVTNLKNGKSVEVRINDRGPFIRGRIIDLSYAAAKAIDMVKDGVVPVRIEIVEWGSGKKKPRPEKARRILTQEKEGKLFVQVGAFIKQENAHRLRDELLKRSFKNVIIVVFKTKQAVYYRVRIRCTSASEAHQVAQRLFQLGYTPIIFD